MIPIPNTNPVSPWAPLWTLLEKAFWQAVQAVLATILLTSSLDTTTAQKWLIAACAAGFTVLANGAMAVALPTGLSPVVDVILRAIRSFAAAFFAPVAAAFMSGGIPSLDGWESALFAGVLAGLAVVKGVVTSLVSKNDTPATLPTSFDLAA